MVIDGDGGGPSNAGQISANHQNDTEFAERVREAQDDGNDDTGQRERKDYLRKGAEAAGTENGGGIEEATVDRFEGGDERLHGKGKTVEHGGEHEAREGEGEPVAEQSLGDFSNGTVRAHGDEGIEAENGGREDERKGDDSLEQEFAAPIPESQPVSDRQPDEQQNRGDAGGETEREKKRLHVS